MNCLVLSALLASAYALPLEDTPEVAAAKAEFKAIFDDVSAGGLAAKQAAQIDAEYLPLNADVEAAAAEFMAAFEDAKAGGLAAKQAPAPAAPAPVAYAIAGAPLAYHVAAAPLTYKVFAPSVVNSIAPVVTKVETAPAITYKALPAYMGYTTYTTAGVHPNLFAYSTYPQLTFGAPIAAMAEVEAADMPAVEAAE